MAGEYTHPYCTVWHSLKSAAGALTGGKAAIRKTAGEGTGGTEVRNELENFPVSRASRPCR
jgi:hypothetical protein